jgi:hypothetical protein
VFDLKRKAQAYHMPDSAYPSSAELKKTGVESLDYTGKMP